MKRPYTVFRPPGLRPIVSLALADYPRGTRQFPFFPLYDQAGQPLPWIRAKSGIDARAGVYFLHDEQHGRLYVGSSIAASQEANVRRTMVRHFQEWHRPQYSQYVTRFRGRGSRMHGQQDTEGGVLFDRQTTSACVLLMAAPMPELIADVGETNQAGPRQLEAFFYAHICSAFQCEGQNAIAEKLPF